MIGVFILYRRNNVKEPFYFDDEYHSLDSLLDAVFDCPPVNFEFPDDVVTDLVFDLIENKCSRRDLWEVYYVKRTCS